MTEQTASDAEDFFDTWTIYRQIVSHNNMFHKEIYADVHGVLAKRGHGFSLLDLGCGDAVCLAPALAELSVERYCGVDLSETALTLAAANLAILSCPVSLQQGDLLQALLDTEQRYDVIFSGFALHHLPSAQKAAFFQAAYRRLSDHGLLLLVDTVRDEHEDLPSYLDAYCRWLRQDWIGISGDEKEIACRHIIDNDLPEPWSTLQSMARDAGFADGRGLSQYRWHRVLCFQRGAAD